LGAHAHGGAGGEDRHHTLPNKGSNMHNSANIVIRFDGVYPDVDGDNLGFTIRSHFIGADGRDYFNSSWIGVQSLMRIGIDLSKVTIEERVYDSRVHEGGAL
jgi:hypothetical protein